MLRTIGPSFLDAKVVYFNIYVLVLYAICLFPANVSAVSFFPESAPNFTEAELTARNIGFDKVNIAGVQAIAIDDMIFFPINEDIRVFSFSGRKWTRGELIYEFDKDVNTSHRKNFRTACGWWEDVTPIVCIEKTTQSNYVTVKSGDSNSSTIGMVANATITIFNWGTLGIIAHEIGHTLGLDHEQSRPDRGEYVYVNEQNVEEGKLNNFEVSEGAETYTQYDFESVMHYGPCAFSINTNCEMEPNEALAKKTIVAATCETDFETLMGQRSKLSTSDVKGMQVRYEELVMSLFNSKRSDVCGTESLSQEQKDEVCDIELGDCGSGASVKLYKAIEEHSDWWCPGGFRAKNCRVEKERYDYHHWRGPRRPRCYYERLHEATWRCGCSYYEVTAECKDSGNGISKTAIEDYLSSSDISMRKLGKFVSRIDAGVLDEDIEPEVTEGLGETLLREANEKEYSRIMGQSLWVLRYKLFFRNVFNGDMLDSEDISSVVARGKEIVFDECLFVDEC